MDDSMLQALTWRTLLESFSNTNKLHGYERSYIHPALLDEVSFRNSMAMIESQKLLYSNMASGLYKTRPLDLSQISGTSPSSEKTAHENSLYNDSNTFKTEPSFSSSTDTPLDLSISSRDEQRRQRIKPLKTTAWSQAADNQTFLKEIGLQRVSPSLNNRTIDVGSSPGMKVETTYYADLICINKNKIALPQQFLLI